MQKRSGKLLISIFLVALLLRLSLIFVAYHGDLNNNISWGQLAAERGLAGFYEGLDWSYSAPNQPPLTILMFAATSVIWQAVENASWWLNNNFPIFPSPFIWFWESWGMTLLVKLPSILADLGIGWLIYKYLLKKKKKLAILITTIWLFNPIIWYNSSIWGQTDSIVNLLGLISVFALLRKNIYIFIVFFVLSLLFKGSLAIFAPILIFVALKQRHTVTKWLNSAFLAFATVLLTSVWFYPHVDFFFWLQKLYLERIFPGEIGYLTANAFNFWWLVDSGKTLDSITYLGLSARVWGFAGIIGSMGAIGYWLRKKFSDKRIFLSFIFLSLAVFLFMTRIHERYLYPFFPYATILLSFIPGVAIPYIVLSITHLLNLYHLFWAPSFAPLEALYGLPWFAQTISIINIIVFFYLLRLFKPTKL